MPPGGIKASGGYSKIQKSQEIEKKIKTRQRDYVDDGYRCRGISQGLNPEKARGRRKETRRKPGGQSECTLEKGASGGAGERPGGSVHPQRGGQQARA